MSTPALNTFTAVPSVYNSLTQTHEPLQSRVPGRVSMYICGPTVYDSGHLGHCRCYLQFDVLRRILGDYFGQRVHFVMNVTDVDDKIIKRAREDTLLREYRQQLSSIDTLYRDIAEAFAHARESTAELDWKSLENEVEAIRAEGSDSDVGHQYDLVMDVCKPVFVPWLVHRSMSSDRVWEWEVFRAHAARFEQEFFEDMRTLGVQQPDVLTRVSDYIPEIIAYIERIVSNGLAYPTAQGNVYFDTREYARRGFTKRPFGGVCVEASDEAHNTDGAFQDKRHMHDFVLWKTSKPGEPFWSSPWGQGRVGWHIECSCMSHAILGERFDVHGGGIDLAGIHHANEIAQSTAYLGADVNAEPWVSQFWHVGHLNIHGLKMSKSLKNFITIRELLQRATPRQVRMLFLLHTWNTPMNFNDSSLVEACAKDQEWREFYLNAQVAVRTADPQLHKWDTHDKELHQVFQHVQDEVHSAFCDNLNYTRALQHLGELQPWIGRYGTLDSRKRLLLEQVLEYVTQILRVLGLDYTMPTTHDSTLMTRTLDILSNFRTLVRSWSRDNGHAQVLQWCDEVRDDQLPEVGVRLEDATQAGGQTVWKLDDPEVLLRERSEKRAREQGALKEHQQRKLDQVHRELVKARMHGIEPKYYFCTTSAGQYQTFDEMGLPTSDAHGEPLSKSAQKQVQKRYQQHVRDYRVHADKLEADPQYVSRLMEQARTLQHQLEPTI